MGVALLRPASALAAFASVTLALSAWMPSARAQEFRPTSQAPAQGGYYPAQQCAPPPPCAAPVPLAPAEPAKPSTGQPAQPSTGTDQGQQAAQAPQVAPEQGLGAERGPAVGGETLAQNMVGDFIGVPAFINLRGPNGATRTARIPLFSRGAFKIAENESPRPQDRVFFNYNFFINANASLSGGNFPRLDVHREVFGFEKTFLDGDASIGLRAPIFETTGDGSVSRDGFGDLSVVLKYAFINDRESGDVLSGGLVITAPTGVKEAILPNGGDIHPTLFQPWGGYIVTFGSDLYVNGFSSVVFPTDSRDVTLWLNDVGIGYWLYRDPSDDAIVTGIVPTLEAHVTTPLNHRHSATDPIVVPDWVVLTAGTHFVLGGGSTLLLGGAVPVTGPKPFDFEFIAQFNLRF